MPSALASVSASVANSGSNSTVASTTRSAGTPAEAAAPGVPTGRKRARKSLARDIKPPEIENDSSLVVRVPLGEGQRSVLRKFRHRGAGADGVRQASNSVASGKQLNAGLTARLPVFDPSSPQEGEAQHDGRAPGGGAGRDRGGGRL